MSTILYRLKPMALEERETDYSADFECLNLETGKKVTITLKQAKGDPASDLVNSCTALAQLLLKAGSEEDDESSVARLH